LAQWRLALIAGVAQLLACSAAAQSTPGTAPPLQLPPGIAPLGYQLDPTVFPSAALRRRMRIDIRFDSPPTDSGFSRDLHVDSVTLNSDRAAPIAATIDNSLPTAPHGSISHGRSKPESRAWISAIVARSVSRWKDCFMSR
jgi:hypothetical protein